MIYSDSNRSSKKSASLGPIELVVLQGTSFCNLNCSYCYLSETSRKTKGSMSLASIETIFTNVLTSPFLGKSLQVSWHSGEPLVLDQDYYRNAIDSIIRLKNKFSQPDFDIQFDIQTNGTLINPQWCAFFKEYRDVLSVGVSCDGPEFLHDAYRKNWAGKPTHRDTCRGIELLRDNGIKFDIIAVVSAESLNFPREFLAFFRVYEGDVRQFHFNLLDELSLDSREHRNLYASKYSNFLITLLDSIREADNPNEFLIIRNFSGFFERMFSDDDTRNTYDARSMSHPFKTLNVDTFGNVSTFYAGLVEEDCEDIYSDGRGLTVGNLITQRLEDIASSRKLYRIAEDFELSHQACESSCEFFPLCSGGYNLIKHKRFGTFQATETPECFIHVKTFAKVMLDDINRSVLTQSS